MPLAQALTPPPCCVIQLPDPQHFIDELGRAGCPRLECVVLNACKTARPLGEQIVAALPHLTVVAWATLVADKAAAAFTRGFYSAIGKGCQAGAPKVSIEEAFQAGEQAFAEGGFRFGDPEKFMHLPARERPHGEYALIKKRPEPPLAPPAAMPKRRMSAPSVSVSRGAAATRDAPGHPTGHGRVGMPREPPAGAIKPTRVRSHDRSPGPARSMTTTRRP